MNYTNAYQKIITVACARGNLKFPGAERHHILPVSMGGTNATENLVYLTTREHFICHKLLIKMNFGESRKKMIYAFWWMCKTRHSINSHIVTSRDYTWARARFIETNFNKDPERQRKIAENRKNGIYKYDYTKVSKTLKTTLGALDKQELLNRMKKSTLTCDQVARGNAIKRGKGSSFLLTRVDGTSVTFWSYDDVYLITGYQYDQIRYRIKVHNGILLDGNSVKYIDRYKGNDARIKRN